MKSLLASLALTTALTIPGLACARPVTLITTLNSYSGNNAFLAYYVTDAQGKYVGSLWMAGGRTNYYKHLRDWFRATKGNPAEINGVTGASVGSGSTWKGAVERADAELHRMSGEAQARIMRTSDFQEGPRAFVEKRIPVWTGS